MRHLDAEEVAWWQAHYEWQPFGEDREDVRAGLIYSVIRNVNRKRGGRCIGPEDVFPHLKQLRRRRHQTIQEMKMVCMALNAAMGGTFAVAAKPEAKPQV